MNLSENIFNNDKTNAVSRTFAFDMQNRKISGLTKPRIKAVIVIFPFKLEEEKLELKPDLKIK